MVAHAFHGQCLASCSAVRLNLRTRRLVARGTFDVVAGPPTKLSSRVTFLSRRVAFRSSRARSLGLVMLSGMTVSIIMVMIH